MVHYLAMIHTYQPTPDLLQNRVILVTGASEGIGRTMARAFASHGATVVLLARTIQKLISLYDEIVQAGFPQPALYPLNLATATPEDYQTLIQTIDTHFGRLEGILLNAAKLGTLTPLEHYPIEQWYEVLQVNLHSAFLLTQAAIPLLKRANDASVVFTTAPEGLQGKAYWGAYGVSKCGVLGLMQTLAHEWDTHSNIRFNSINPGKVQTMLRKSAYPAENNRTLPCPTDLITPYLYLMGPDSHGVTGTNLNL